LKKHLPDMVSMSKYGWNWKIEILHEGCMILLLFVMLCAWNVPSNPSQSPHSKHWHLRVYCHGSFGLAKASKVRAATWHMIWNSWREMLGPIFYTQVMKTNYFRCQKKHG
jgi:hypothetical protein